MTSARVVVVLLALGASGWWWHTREDEFPHRKHEGLFPVCTGCHAGIVSGVDATRYPDSASCEQCHDGETEPRVAWEGPGARASNLDFDHRRHTEVARPPRDSLTCLTCHREEGAVGTMAAARARPETCVGCHAHEVAEHLDEAADCHQCHLRVADATALSPIQIDSFPQPRTHLAADFVSRHVPASPAAEATCAVCHAQESCARCHVNAASVALIAELPHDDRVAALALHRAAEYPIPANHRRAGWTYEHADAVRDGGSPCANCHAQPSCRACHQDADVREIATLPNGTPPGAAGVTLAAEATVVHPRGFTETHGIVAATTEGTCWSCHGEQAFCIDCHDGPAVARFHTGNFRERHGAVAYGGALECSSCHSPEVFCRGCHAGVGFASEGRIDVAFHTAKPFWLLGHGQSARQGLETCTTCHAQSDCAQCHAATGAWRINPHGPDYDGARAFDRNRFACRQCHRDDPTERR